MTTELNTEAKNAPKIFFIYLLTTITLFISIYCILALTFSYIDKAFPNKDEITLMYSSVFQLRSVVAEIIIAYPTLIITTYFLMKEHTKHPKQNLVIKNWFTYFIAFIAGLVILWNLFSVLNDFLQNTLTARMLIKTIITCLANFLSAQFYFQLLKRSLQKPRIIASITTIVVIGLIGYGIYLIKTTPTFTPTPNKTFSVRDLPSPNKPIAYCKNRSLKATTDENNAMQRLIAKFSAEQHCHVGNNCLLKWDDHDQIKFSLAWEKNCALGAGSTFYCSNNAGKLCCSLYGGDSMSVCAE